MASPKTFADGMHEALELLNFFSQTYTQTYPCRAILLQAGTDNRVAPEEVVGKATLVVSADGLDIRFVPDDVKRAVLNVGRDVSTNMIEVDMALLGMDSEDIVFRRDDFGHMTVWPGDAIWLLDKPSDS